MKVRGDGSVGCQERLSVRRLSVKWGAVANSRYLAAFASTRRSTSIPGRLGITVPPTLLSIADEVIE